MLLLFVVIPDDEEWLVVIDVVVCGFVGLFTVGVLTNGI